MITADTLNNHLMAGGVVQVSTHLKSYLYQKKHAGMFVQDGKNLYVKHGKQRNCLASGDMVYVAIRMGRVA
jgi:hypothetical protein